MNEIVVAHYKEDTTWMRRIPKEWRVTVYEKGGGKFGFPLENVGREPHTFLEHIVRNYHSLADVTAFVQGNPLEHDKNLFQNINNYQGKGFAWLGHWQVESERDGTPYHAGLLMVRFMEEIVLRPPSDWPIKFYAGGQFIVDRETIHKKPRAWYMNARHQSTFEDAKYPWCFERLWEEIFK